MRLEAREKDLTEDHLKYDPDVPIRFPLGGDYVHLPHPLGATEGSCRAGLQMMKYLSEMSYRTNDLLKTALKELLAGNLWDALELYEEAADLGVLSAQANAVYIYDLLSRWQCVNYDDIDDEFDYEYSGNATAHRQEASIGQGEGSSMLADFGLDPSKLERRLKLQSKKWSTSLLLNGSTDESLLLELYTRLPLVLYNHSNHSRIDTAKCHLFFKRMSTRRWIQLFKNGDAAALLKLADVLTLPKPRDARSRNGTLALIKNTLRDFVKFGSGSGSDLGVPHNNSHAVLLLALAAEMGDVDGLMQLGWRARDGYTGLRRNLTAADQFFISAMKREERVRYDRLTSDGVAPWIGRMLVWVDRLSEKSEAFGPSPRSHSSSSSTVAGRTKTFFEEVKPVMREYLHIVKFVVALLIIVILALIVIKCSSY